MWLKEEMPNDMFAVVKLAGFNVEDPEAERIEWAISFETNVETWLGITIPFIGEEPQSAIVDTCWR
jgi:hypothetical protein